MKHSFMKYFLIVGTAVLALLGVTAQAISANLYRNLEIGSTFIALPSDTNGSQAQKTVTIGHDIRGGKSATCAQNVLIDGYECTLVRSDVGPAHKYLYCEYDCPNMPKEDKPTYETK